VCSLGDLQDGVVTEVRVAKRRAGAVRLGNDVVVFSGTCPHRGGPLCLGKMRYALTSRVPGQIDVDRGQVVVSCPWHGWEFRLDTGFSLVGDKLRVKIYDTEVIDDRVIVYLSSNAKPPR
jgi:nitrite reductase/ring-hydroxylating ferredoxin subunit